MYSIIVILKNMVKVLNENNKVQIIDNLIIRLLILQHALVILVDNECSFSVYENVLRTAIQI
jgi:hypothetical protein